MTTTIQFGKDKYHLQGEMANWCKTQLGQNPNYGDWVYDEPKTWEGLGTWCMSSMFGTTIFYFKDESDATMFALKWL